MNGVLSDRSAPCRVKNLICTLATLELVQEFPRWIGTNGKNIFIQENSSFEMTWKSKVVFLRKKVHENIMHKRGLT